MKSRWTAALALIGAVAFAASCGDSGIGKATIAPGGTVDPAKWPADDRSICKYKEKPELEVSESVGPGSPKPNVRRVYKLAGDRETRRKVLVCREIDTNLDGIKDVARMFNDRGEAIHEEADTNYDGRVDSWADFENGRLAKSEVDTNFDGRVDVWKFYVEGELLRVRRSTHCPNGKEDIWEVYVKGRLDRIGSDLDCDGHVDRWDRDTERMRKDEQQRRAQVEAAADSGARVSAPDASVSDASLADARTKAASIASPDAAAIKRDAALEAVQ